MRSFFRRFSVVAGFTLLVAILLVNAAVTRSQLSGQIRRHLWVTHTQSVLLALSQTQSLLRDAETGQRGFLYTGREEYLRPYEYASGKIESQLDELAALTADNASQQARIGQLRDLSRQKLSELSKTVALYRDGHPDQAKALVLSNLGLHTMERIRSLEDEMQREELALQQSRLNEYAASTRRTVGSIYLASLIAVLGLAILAVYILRENRLRELHAAEIRQREQWFRVTLTSIGDGVIATDPEGNVSFINSVAEQLTGFSLAEAKGKPIGDIFRIFNEQSRLPVENPVRKVMGEGNVLGLANHTVLKRKDGQFIPIEDSAAPIRDDNDHVAGVVLVFRDAARERKSQEILRKTEKLAAAARLSATMAHEINNPLEAVVNLIYIAKSTPGVPSDVGRLLTIAENELERISHITRQTLGFYRESKAPQLVDVARLVDSVLQLYANKLRAKNIVLERNFSECPPVLGLQGELQQLVSNLISNAADAVGREGKVCVAISAAKQQDAVELTVEDDGPGIASEYIEQIFEPFFTTKKDVGTGLGLWVAKEIAERHGGSIRVQTFTDEERHGSMFTVYLPCENRAVMAEAS